MTKKATIGIAALVLGLATTGAATVASGFWPFGDDDAAEGAGAEATELGWEDLVPADYEPPPDPFLTMSTEEMDELFDGSAESQAKLAEMDEAMRYAPTVPELDGRRVKIPGFVVPLDFDGQTRMDEFLLVPYYGACIHTPPPPANQVVHATAERAVTIEDTYSPVWLYGTIRTETVTSELAESGYRLEVTAVEAYEYEEPAESGTEQGAAVR